MIQKNISDWNFIFFCTYFEPRQQVFEVEAVNAFLLVNLSEEVTRMTANLRTAEESEWRKQEDEEALSIQQVTDTLVDAT